MTTNNCHNQGYIMEVIRKKSLSRWCGWTGWGIVGKIQNDRMDVKQRLEQEAKKREMALIPEPISVAPYHWQRRASVNPMARTHGGPRWSPRRTKYHTQHPPPATPPWPDMIYSISQTYVPSLWCRLILQDPFWFLLDFTAKTFRPLQQWGEFLVPGTSLVCSS